MPTTTVYVSFRFADKINATSGSPVWGSMTAAEKNTAKSELCAAISQQAVVDEVANWSSVAITTDSCCEISDADLKSAIDTKLSASSAALASALGFSPVTSTAAPETVCKKEINGTHTCSRLFTLKKGSSGPVWTETSSTYSTTAAIVLLAQWTT